MKHFYRYFLSLAVFLMVWTGSFSFQASAAVSWPEDTYVEAGSGILMDADSGTILYGKNIHEPFYPASITKILTALIVIENCDLDEMVTFSYDAVHNVEENSSNMAASEGDVLTVRDCLYGLLLASANESANALAEHVAGSREAFADMMNQKAAELGCQDSHFANPSGLNDPNHYTSAYDMALITQAALQNETFVEIDSALYWKHAPIKQYPDPEDPHNVVYAHHQMLKKNSSVYYPGAFGGKTGYTSLAGNTLVTCAQRDGMTLITVILNGQQVHYTDTKRLMDFGFNNFRTLNVADYDSTYTSIENDMTIAGLTTSSISVLSLDPGCSVTLPKDAGISDTETTLNYDLPSTAPENAVAQIQYACGGRAVGSAYLLLKEIEAPVSSALLSAESSGESESSSPEETSLETAAEDFPLPSPAPVQESVSEGQSAEETPESLSGQDTKGRTSAPEDGAGFRLPKIPAFVWIPLAVVVILAGLSSAAWFLKQRHEQREARERMRRKARREQRLKDIGCSQEDFELLLKEKKSSSYKAKRPPRHGGRRR